MNVYLRRLIREKEIIKIGNYVRDMDKQVLSENPKTGVSLNFPVINCKPTVLCATYCYGCLGHCITREAIAKAIAIHRWIRNEPVWMASKVEKEARGQMIRLAGTGEMSISYKDFLERLDPKKLFGFTRKIDVWQMCEDLGIHLMFSVDESTPVLVKQWVGWNIKVSRVAYMRRSIDPDRSDAVAVTFPIHGGGRKPEKVPISRSDCKAIRKHVVCDSCKRCY